MCAQGAKPPKTAVPGPAGQYIVTAKRVPVQASSASDSTIVGELKKGERVQAR